MKIINSTFTFFMIASILVLGGMVISQQADADHANLLNVTEPIGISDVCGPLSTSDCTAFSLSAGDQIVLTLHVTGVFNPLDTIRVWVDKDDFDGNTEIFREFTDSGISAPITVIKNAEADYEIIVDTATLADGDHMINVDGIQTGPPIRTVSGGYLITLGGGGPVGGGSSNTAFGQTTILGTCGLSFPDGNTVDYGALLPNTISNEVALNMTNSGSVTALLEILGTDWKDTSNNSVMNVNQTHFNQTDFQNTYSSKALLNGTDGIVTNSFVPSKLVQLLLQLETILLNPSFTGTASQTMDFTVSC